MNLKIYNEIKKKLTSTLIYYVLNYLFSFTFISVILFLIFFFFFNDTATTEIYTLSLHDALPILMYIGSNAFGVVGKSGEVVVPPTMTLPAGRSEEHTSELQSRGHLVCRLLL